MSKYPRIGTRYKVSGKRERMKRCLLCGEKATQRIDIQTTWTRGDDEVVFVCETHGKAPVEVYLQERATK